jgi:hypothetical protein
MEKRVIVSMPEGLHRELKTWAASSGVTLRALIVRLLKEGCENGKKV